MPFDQLGFFLFLEDQSPRLFIDLSKLFVLLFLLLFGFFQYLIDLCQLHGNLFCSVQRIIYPRLNIGALFLLGYAVVIAFAGTIFTP